MAEQQGQGWWKKWADTKPWNKLVAPSGREYDMPADEVEVILAALARHDRLVQALEQALPWVSFDGRIDPYNSENAAHWPKRTAVLLKALDALKEKP